MTSARASGERPVDPGVHAWSLLLRTHAAVVATLERELQAARGISLSWYDVLLELYQRPAGLRMQDLAEVVVLSRTRVSRVVDELEASGLVARQPNPQDKRSTIVVITPTGRSTFRRAAPVYLRGIARHFADALTAEELDCVGRGLEKVLARHRHGTRA